MNIVTQHYFTLHFTFTEAIKSLRAWHLLNAGLHNGGGGSYNQTCILQHVHTVHSLSEIACCEGQTHTLAQTTITMTYHVWKQNITTCLWYLNPSHQAYCIHTSPIRHILHAGNNQYIVYTKRECKINANFTTYLWHRCCIKVESRSIKDFAMPFCSTPMLNVYTSRTSSRYVHFTS
jgi:hypothetical protein